MWHQFGKVPYSQYYFLNHLYTYRNHKMHGNHKKNCLSIEDIAEITKKIVQKVVGHMNQSPNINPTRVRRWINKFGEESTRKRGFITNSCFTRVVHSAVVVSLAYKVLQTCGLGGQLWTICLVVPRNP